jgi:hypothetical protein
MVDDDEILPSFGSTDADGLDGFRDDALAALPGLLDRAIDTYKRFASEVPPEDTKGFVAYQAGCRAALAHIHLLVKLVHWARSSAGAAPCADDEQLDRLVREAELALGNEPPAHD